MIPHCPLSPHKTPLPCFHVHTQVTKYLQLEEPVYSAQLSAPLPVPTSYARHQPPSAAAAAAAAEEEELESDVALRLDAACSKAFDCLAGVLQRCVVLTGLCVWGGGVSSI